MGLLEGADSASTPTNLPSLERTVTFRVLDSAPGRQQESFTSVVVLGSGRHDETTLGSFPMLYVYVRGASHDPMVLRSGSPDLNAKGLSIIREWTFTLAFGNGKPYASRGNLVLHFC